MKLRLTAGAGVNIREGNAGHVVAQDVVYSDSHWVVKIDSCTHTHSLALRPNMN